MGARWWLLLLLAFGCLFAAFDASPGDADPVYRTCVQQCEETGAVGDNLVNHCQFSHDDEHSNNSWYRQGSLYLQWKELNCRSDCRYNCMMQREKERELLGLSPVKYHGKWPFKRVLLFQEPLSTAFSVLNLAMHFTGWLSFFILVNYKLPRRPHSERIYYEYSGLWHIYAALSMNAWLWSAIFHTWVMFAAPILAFMTTHIIYLNIYNMDYGWNMKLCVAMGIGQMLVWAVWAGMSRHPSRLKLWTVVLGGGLAMLLEIYDFPPYHGYADAHALWHATTIPLTHLWWSFIKDDAEIRTLTLTKRDKTNKKVK